jgi:pyruvate formate lyase activating enzyme
MRIGGFQKLSLIDHPGQLSAVVFTQGCNFQCPYCHNPELVDPKLYVTPITEELIISFLKKRIRRIQSIVITGGEPTLHSDLPDFLIKIHSLGFSTKLDTNGSCPQTLRSLIKNGLVDFISMDVKAPLASYARITRSRLNPDTIQQSIRLILESGLPHEFRTTFHDTLLSLEDMESIGKLVKGCGRFTLQKFMPTKALDPDMLSLPSPSTLRLHEISRALNQMGIPCSLG